MKNRLFFTKLSIVLLVGMSLISNVATIVKESRTYVRTKGIDDISFHESRFKPIIKKISQFDRLGYRTDNDDPVRAYYATQYVLAPVILIHGDHPRYTLTDFKSIEARKKYDPSHNWHLHAQFSPQLSLFQRDRE